MMRKSVVLLLMLFAGLLAAFLALTPVCNPLGSDGDIAMGLNGLVDAVPGELLVKYHEPTLAIGRRIVNGAIGAREIERIEELGVSHVALDPGIAPEEAARRLDSMPGVEYAEPNIVLQMAMTPSDPFYMGRQKWYYELVGAPKAWDVETGEPGVIVAVLDTGVDVTHPDLKDSIWTNRDETPGNGIDDDNNGCLDDVRGCNFGQNEKECPFEPSTPNGDIDDDVGHGSFVAGIIAAKGNNAIGVIGIAPNVTVMPVKVLDCQGLLTASAVAQAIVYAAQEGARVINMSFGWEDATDDMTQTMRAAIDIAHDQYGVVLVGAAGNDTRGTVAFPARYEKVIAVSASDHSKKDDKAYFSNWGTEIAVTAPGVDIASTLPLEFCGTMWTCLGEKPYAMEEGTSFSAPLVAGAAALILSKGPPMSPDAVKSRLTSTARSLPDGSHANWDGAGLIQVDLALEGKSYQVGVSGITRN